MKQTCHFNIYDDKKLHIPHIVSIRYCILFTSVHSPGHHNPTHNIVNDKLVSQDK